MILIGLLMFMLLILVHELGHFLGAKMSNIKVNEFSIGMGPSIYKKQTEETLYSLRALPLGGYVAMEGEDSESSDERSFENASKFSRFITVLAGPMMNFITAFIIFLIINLTIGVKLPIINEVLKDTPAYTANLQKGDRIIAIDDKNINTFNDMISATNASNGKEISVKFIRNSEEKEIKLTPKKDENYYYMGFSSQRDKSLIVAISYSFFMIIDTISGIWNSLIMLVSGAIGLNALSGPIGVVKMAGQVAEKGFIPLLMFISIISINLGFFNLLPIPALDGSKILLILIEAITGRKINKKLEQTIAVVGFISLLGLIIIISVKDVINIFS